MSVQQLLGLININGDAPWRPSEPRRGDRQGTIRPLPLKSRMINDYEKWRVANEAATVAAKAMFDKTCLALDGEGDLASHAEAQEVKRLQRIADDLLDMAIQRMNAEIAARVLDRKSKARQCYLPPPFSALQSST